MQHCVLCCKKAPKDASGTKTVSGLQSHVLSTGDPRCRGVQAPPEACANLSLQDAARQVSVEDYTDLVRSHASIHREHSLTVARLNSLQSEREAADSQLSAALAQLQDMRRQHAHAQTETGVRLKQLHGLLQELVQVQQERTAMLSTLAALEAQVQSHEGLEAEYENLLSANGRTCSEHELLQADHQELTREHAVLAHSFQQVNEQCKELQEEVQQLLARQRQHDLAQEQHSVTLAELDNTHQAYSADLHRLQEEVLRLEDTLHTANLEHTNSKAAFEEQLRQAGKQQSAQYSKYVANLQELEEVGAQRHSLEVELEKADHRDRELQAQSAHLQRRLQHSQDWASNLQRSLDEALKQLGATEIMLEVSDSRCSMLERQLAHSRESHSDVQSELAALQADLKKLHDLAAGNRLTAQDLHQMFAKPVSSEDTTSHSLPPPNLASDSAITAAAAAADGSHHVGRNGADQPSADEPGLCSDPPAESMTRPIHATSYAEPGPTGTPEAVAAAPQWTVSTAATSHGQVAIGCSGAADDSKGVTGESPTNFGPGLWQQVSSAHVSMPAPICFRVTGSLTGVCLRAKHVGVVCSAIHQMLVSNQSLDSHLAWHACVLCLTSLACCASHDAACLPCTNTATSLHIACPVQH